MSEEAVPNLNTVVPLSDGHPLGQNRAFKDAHLRARKFALSLSSAIEQEYLGACIDRIVYIFLFKVRPSHSAIDPWIWIVVGDLPSACLRCEECKTPYEALGIYIEEMRAWAAAAREGKSVAGLIPVNVPATPANAEMLDSRLKFLDEKILPLLKNEERSEAP